jgi:signal peptidase II
MNKTRTLLLVLATCVSFDQCTKYTAKYYLEGEGVYRFIGDTFRLGYSENTGAFLGMGSSMPEGVRTLIFSGLVAIFLLAFLVYIIKSHSVSKTDVIASGLIIGGGFSNLIDRLVNDGAVIDFMNLGIGSLRTGIFNVADMTIMLGAFLLLFHKKQGVEDS